MKNDNYLRKAGAKVGIFSELAKFSSLFFRFLTENP